jgi:hypothetical protein
VVVLREIPRRALRGSPGHPSALQRHGHRDGVADDVQHRRGLLHIIAQLDDLRGWGVGLDPVREADVLEARPRLVGEPQEALQVQVPLQPELQALDVDPWAAAL